MACTVHFLPAKVRGLTLLIKTKEQAEGGDYMAIESEANRVQTRAQTEKNEPKDR